MSNLNPSIKISKSTGIDLPVMYVYLAGRIAGNCIEKCVGWRQAIVNHYKNYKPVEEGFEAYPISFLDPLNSGESNSIDKQGLTSHIPPNLIYDKDLLSVQRANVIVANVEDYFEEGITFMNLDSLTDLHVHSKETLFYQIKELEDKIKNRRENFGTICEIAWALYLTKPLILIVPESRKEIYQKHPFAKRASVIVTSVDQLLQEKWLQTLYKSIAGAIY